MTEALKPCPFCASDRLHIAAEGESGTDGRGRAFPYRVTCTSCGGQSQPWFQRSLAVDAWNRRAPAEGS